MVVLSKKSWHFWLYKQFFPVSSYSMRKMDNLCPYFWKVVLCILILPVSFVLALPALIFMLFFIDSENREPLGDVVGKGFAVWVVLGLLISMVAMFFSNNKAIEAFGLVGWVFGGVLLLGAIISAVYDKLKNRVSSKPTLLGEFLKAKKNKYCPKIQWDSEENKHERTKVLQEEE